MVNIPVVGNVDLAEYLEKLLGESASIDDLLEKLNSTEGQAVLSILKAIGVDTDTFMKAFQTISDYLPESVTSFKVTFGAPQKAGGYTVIAAVVDPSYQAAVGIGYLHHSAKDRKYRVALDSGFLCIKLQRYSSE